MKLQSAPSTACISICVTEWRAASGASNHARAAAALERGSEHPLAAAIVAAAAERGVELPASSEFSSITGKGVTGEVDGHRVALGNVALFGELGIAGLLAGGVEGKPAGVNAVGHHRVTVAGLFE